MMKKGKYQRRLESQYCGQVDSGADAIRSLIKWYVRGERICASIIEVESSVGTTVGYGRVSPSGQGINGYNGKVICCTGDSHRV